MPDVRAQLIISAKDEATQVIQGVGQATAGAGNAAKDTSFKLTELWSAYRIGTTVLRAVKGAYDETIGVAVTWGQTVEQLSAISGTTTEKASEMATVLGDFGMDANSMNMAVKTLTKEGLQFNLDTLEKLAGQYQAIQDPVAKDQFLFTNFGRSGADLAMLLSQPVSKLQDMATAADNTGKVLSGPAAQALVDYGIKVKQLSDNWQGLAIALSQDALPALAGAVQQETANFQAIDILNKQVDAGHISRAQMIAELLQIELGFADTNKFVAENITWLQGDSTSSRTLRDDWDAASKASGDLSGNVQTVSQDLAAQAKHTEDVTAYWKHYIDTVNSADLAAQAQHIQDITVYWNKYADAIGGANDALAMQAVQAGQAGTLATNENSYLQTLAQNEPKIADLKDQITKLTAAQGEQITVTAKGQYTAEQYAVAQERLTIAEERLTAYHGKSKAELDSLTLSVRTAQDTLDKMNGHMATSSTSTADYTTKLGDLNGQLFDLETQEMKAKEAMDKANASFIEQQIVAAAAAEGHKLDADALLKLDLSLGLIDKPTYAASEAAIALGKSFGDGAISVNQLTTQAGNLVDKFNGDLTKTVDKVPDVMKPTIDAFNATYNAVTPATTAILEFHSAEDALHDKHVTVTTEYVSYYTTHGAQNGPGDPAPHAAGGADFIVPPGFSNDNFPMFVGSGEHVKVTPAGGSSKTDAILTQLMIALPQMIGRAVRDNITVIR